MSRPSQPPKPGEIWRPKHGAHAAVVVRDCRGGTVSYARLDDRRAGTDLPPADTERSPLERWDTEFEIVFEKQDHADAGPVRRRCLIDDCAAQLRGCAVLELGAHVGGLTRSIRQHARWTTVVENNPRCIPILEELLAGAGEVVHDDMHRVLWTMPRGAFDVIVCAGVLYHSASPLSLLEAMADLAPARILVDTVNDGVEDLRLVPALMTNRLNYRYNRRPDCGFSIVLGDDVIERAMAHLGYASAARIDKAGVAVAAEHDSDYLRAWRRSYAAWFYRTPRGGADDQADEHV